MLDEGSCLGRRKPVRRTPAERSAILAETYDPGATVAAAAGLGVFPSLGDYAAFKFYDLRDTAKQNSA